MIRQERNDERMVKWIFNVRPGERNSAEKLGTRLILKSIRTKDCIGLVMLKERKSMLGLVNVENSKLTVVFPERNQRTHGTRQSEVILNKEKSTKSKLKT